MFKKLVCCISVVALLLSAIFPVAMFVTSAAEPIAATGDNLIWGFDSISDVAESEWMSRFPQIADGMQLALETGTANVYGGTGKSLKLMYNTAFTSGGNPPAIKTSSSALSITPKGKGFSFWLNSENAVKLRLSLYDGSAWYHADFNAIQGASLYNLEYSKFANYNSTKITQINLRTVTANQTNTVYFDNFGFFAEEEKKPVAASGAYLMEDGFDSFNAVTDTKWCSRFNNGGMEVFLETATANVYGGSGKSLKVVYDTSKLNGTTTPHLWVGDNKITPKGDGITFWLKSEKKTKIRVAANAGGALALSPVIDIALGENLIFIKWSEFECTKDLSETTTSQMQIRTYVGNEQNTFYFDNFGFFDDPNKGEEPEKPIVEKKLPGTAKLLYGFDKYKKLEDMNDAWVANSVGAGGAGLEMSLNSDVANVYGGEGNSLKVVYDRNAGLNDRPCIMHKANITTEAEGFIFWIKSEEATAIKLAGTDKDNTFIDTNNIALVKGENKIVVKYSDFKQYGTVDLSVIKQLQIRPVGTNKTGTYYLDSFGFYTKPSVHKDDFFEVALDTGKWTKNTNASKATFVWEESSEYYHNASTDVKDNTSSLKVTYKDLESGSNNTNSVYYNNPLRVSDYEPYIYGEDSELAFWIYSEQEVNLTLLYSDKDSTGANKNSTNKQFVIPEGESIIRVSMKDMMHASRITEYKEVFQLQFRFNSTANTINPATGNVWIDAIGFYDKNPDKNTSPQLLDDKAFVWWDFDDDETAEETGWQTRWPGKDNKGISYSIDSTPENVYGGSGKSLKVEYKAAESDNGQPAIWLGDKRMAMYGEGIVFWIKSQYQTKIRLVGIDTNGVAVVTDRIPIKIGENIITVKYSDFYEMTPNGATLNLSTLNQLQIRAGQADANTFWIDSIGFYNITDDGSNTYYSINPPESYKDWYEGESVVGQDFDKYVDDTEMEFCAEWYFDDNGWIALENIAGSNVLRMDYDFTNGAKSILTNITSYKEVDPKGGISFWAKSSEERYYTLKIWFGPNTSAIVVFKATPGGKEYNIPFSAFWMEKKVDVNYTPSSEGAVNIPKMTIISDETCNPPSMGASEKFSLWLDNIKFVDSSSYKRAGDVNHYENGVRLVADKEAFSTGVYPSIKIENLTDKQKADHLANMKQSETFGALYKIDAFDIYGVSAVPKKAVDLIFDVPEGVKAENMFIYQLFLDGSTSKRSVTITEDGKVKASVYRLGNYVVGYGDGSAVNTTDATAESTVKTEGTSPLTGNNGLSAVFAITFTLSALTMLYFGGKLCRKVRRKNEK